MRLRDVKKTRFKELEIVSLAGPVRVTEGLLPSGAKGTVVAAYGDGRGYEVEFDEPFHCVVTLEGEQIR